MPRVFPPAEIDNALLALARLGNAAAASKETGISASTLKDWLHPKSSHFERYCELRRKFMDQSGHRLAALHEDAAQAAILKARAAVDSVDIAQLPNSDKGKIAQQLAVASGIHTQRANELRGRPTIHVQHHTATELLDRLEREAGAKFIDSTGEEIPPAKQLAA